MPEPSVIRVVVRPALDLGSFRRREEAAVLQVNEVEKVGITCEDR
jgi:hypothetical protein